MCDLMLQQVRFRSTTSSSEGERRIHFHCMMIEAREKKRRRKRTKKRCMVFGVAPCMFDPRVPFYQAKDIDKIFQAKKILPVPISVLVLNL